MNIDLNNKFDGSRSGSTKCDAYLWAIEEYIDNYLISSSITTIGDTNGFHMAYYIDYFWTTNGYTDYGKATVPNHDYAISKKGFFWDLNVYNDSLPIDDPQQPMSTDYNTLLTLLSKFYEQVNQYNENLGNDIIQVHGFTPWAFKYVDDDHPGVATEWLTVTILSNFNAIVDADACCVGTMTNAAFYMHYPLKERYTLPSSRGKQLQPETLMEKGYLFWDDISKVWKVKELKTAQIQ